MKQKEAVKAYLAVRDLNQQKVSSVKLAKQIFDLYQILQKYWDFQGQEEIKINERYPDIDFAQGKINMNEIPAEKRQELIEKVNQINAELRELGETEIDDLKFEKIIIELDREPNLMMSGDDIGALQSFIEFK